MSLAAPEALAVTDLHKSFGGVKGLEHWLSPHLRDASAPVLPNAAFVH